MQRMTMPNFCINFLNKAAKLLPTLYDFAVASLADAWIKISAMSRCVPINIVASLADAWIKMLSASLPHLLHAVASLADAWIKMEQQKVYLKWKNKNSRIPRGCVD